MSSQNLGLRPSARLVYCGFPYAAGGCQGCHGHLYRSSPCTRRTVCLLTRDVGSHVTHTIHVTIEISGRQQVDICNFKEIEDDGPLLNNGNYPAADLWLALILPWIKSGLSCLSENRLLQDPLENNPIPSCSLLHKVASVDIDYVQKRRNSIFMIL